MFLLISAVALILISLLCPDGAPLSLRVALIANAAALILDAILRVKKVKRGEHDAENP